MTEKLEKAVASAKALRGQARPVRAVILEVLSNLSSDDITTIVEEAGSSKERLAQIAVAGGYPDNVVTDVLGTFLRLDLRSQSCQYAACREYYESRQDSERDVLRDLHGLFQGDAKFFVLYGLVFRWAIYESSLLGMPFDDNDTNRLCIGYLASQGLAFETVVDLLQLSYRQSWPKWESLWRYY